MKQFGIIAMVFLLTASILTGCRKPDAGTTGATNNNPSTSSTTKIEPSITMPGTTGATNSTNGQGRTGPRS